MKKACQFIYWVLPGLSLGFTLICLGMIGDGLVNGDRDLVLSGATALITAAFLWFATWAFRELSRGDAI